MKFLQKAGYFMLFGFGYSLMLILTGPRFLNFLTLPVIAQGIYFSVLTLLVYAMLTWLLFDINDSYRTSLFLGVIGFHFLIWVTVFSSLSDDGWWIKFIMVSFFVLILPVVYWGRKRFSAQFRISSVLALVLIVVFLNLSLGFLPPGLIGPTVHVGSSDFTLPKPVQVIFYPSSVPMKDAITLYSWVLPEVSDGSKIMLVSLDAFREDYLGKNLSGVQLTPNMKKMADEHRYYENYRVQAPRSKASVASFFSGKYPREHGTYDFGLVQEFTGDELPGAASAGDEDYYGHALPDQVETMPERLQDTNFHTTGLVTVGHIYRRYNYDQGFNHYENAPWPGTKQDLYIIRRTIFELLRNDSPNSFFYLHYPGAHFPYIQGKKNTRFWKQTRFFEKGKIRFREWELDPLEELIQRKAPVDVRENHPEELEFLRHLYGSSLHYYDLYVIPNLITSLKRLGVYDQTLFMITSDHGENLFDSQNYYGHGRTLKDHTVNVPLILKPPRDSPWEFLHSSSDEVMNVESIDLTTTILEFAGASTENVGGVSFLSGADENRRIDRFDTSVSEILNRGPLNRKTFHSIAVAHEGCKYLYRYEKNEGTFEWPCSLSHFSDSEMVMKSLIEKFDSSKPEVDTSAQYVGIPEKEVENLKGLGYFQ